MTDLNVAEIHARWVGYDATAFLGFEGVQRLWRKRDSNEQTTSGQKQKWKWAEGGTIGGCHTASSVSYQLSEMKVPKGHSRFIQGLQGAPVIARSHGVRKAKRLCFFQNRLSQVGAPRHPQLILLQWFSVG